MLAGSPSSAPSRRRGLTSDRLTMAFGVLVFSGLSAALRSIAYMRGSRRPEARMTGVLASARSPANSANAMTAHCALEMQQMFMVPLALPRRVGVAQHDISGRGSAAPKTGFDCPDDHQSALCFSTNASKVSSFFLARSLMLSPDIQTSFQSIDFPFGFVIQSSFCRSFHVPY